MAEVIGVASSILQIAGAGVKLSTVLYNSVGSAGRADSDIADIADDVKLTANALDSIGRIFEKEAGQSLMSTKAMSDAQSLITRCESVFGEIQQVADKRRKVGKDGRLSLSTLGTLSWPTKEQRVELLRRRLESLKNSLMLLLHVLQLANGQAKGELQQSGLEHERERIRELHQRQQDSLKALQALESKLSTVSLSDDETLHDFSAPSRVPTIDFLVNTSAPEHSQTLTRSAHHLSDPAYISNALTSDSETSDSDGTIPENKDEPLTVRELAHCAAHVRRLLLRITTLQQSIEAAPEHSDSRLPRHRVQKMYRRFRRKFESQMVVPKADATSPLRKSVLPTIHTASENDGTATSPVFLEARSRSFVPINISNQVEAEKRVLQPSIASATATTTSTHPTSISNHAQHRVVDQSGKATGPSAKIVSRIDGQSPKSSRENSAKVSWSDDDTDGEHVSQDLIPLRKTKTGRISKAKKGLKVHACGQCGKLYSRAEHLKRHQKNHGSTQVYCDLCGKVFYRADLLQRHRERYQHTEHGPRTDTSVVEDHSSNEADDSGPRALAPAPRDIQNSLYPTLPGIHTITDLQTESLEPTRRFSGGLLQKVTPSHAESATEAPSAVTTHDWLSRTAISPVKMTLPADSSSLPHAPTSSETMASQVPERHAARHSDWHPQPHSHSNLVSSGSVSTKGPTIEDQSPHVQSQNTPVYASPEDRSRKGGVNSLSSPLQPGFSSNSLFGGVTAKTQDLRDLQLDLDTSPYASVNTEPNASSRNDRPARASRAVTGTKDHGQDRAEVITKPRVRTERKVERELQDKAKGQAQDRLASPHGQPHAKKHAPADDSFEPGEVLHQLVREAGADKYLEQQRKVRKDFFDDYWARPHEPASSASHRVDANTRVLQQPIAQAKTAEESHTRESPRTRPPYRRARSSSFSAGQSRSPSKMRRDFASPSRSQSPHARRRKVGNERLQSFSQSRSPVRGRRRRSQSFSRSQSRDTNDRTNSDAANFVASNPALIDEAPVKSGNIGPAAVDASLPRTQYTSPGTNTNLYESESSKETPRLRGHKILACRRCRQRKLKCDKKVPACTSCDKSNHASECSMKDTYLTSNAYIAPTQDSALSFCPEPSASYPITRRLSMAESYKQQPFPAQVSSPHTLSSTTSQSEPSHKDSATRVYGSSGSFGHVADTAAMEEEREIGREKGDNDNMRYGHAQDIQLGVTNTNSSILAEASPPHGETTRRAVSKEETPRSRKRKAVEARLPQGGEVDDGATKLRANKRRQGGSSASAKLAISDGEGPSPTKEAGNGGKDIVDLLLEQWTVPGH